MKKIVFIISCLILGIIVGTTIFGSKNTNNSTRILSQNQSKTQQESNVSSTTIIDSPTTLDMPTLNISAPIEYVGMDSQGRMDVPKEDMNVAWYKLGYKPGGMGSTVIAGHFDKANGSPAVFNKLSTLKPGDEIIVKGKGGKSLTFEVEDKKQYLDASFPLQKVFNTTDQPRLNLITCDGVWDPNARNYSQRLVIFATLSPTTP